MKRLLKIKEFFHLKKRSLVGGSDGSSSSRPAKRPRRAYKLEPEAEYKTQSVVDGLTRRRQRFLDLFEDEVAKDIVWWLPGRRGEAFALNRERFERELLKAKFQGQSFNAFLGSLNKWGFRQMNIPSLSGRVLAFELSSQNVAGWRTGPRLSRGKSTRRRQQQLQQQQQRNSSRSSGGPAHLAGLINLEHEANPAAFLDPGYLQQAQYLVQQEITQNYVSLLWQELQRQLTILLLYQGHSSMQAIQQPQQRQHPQTEQPARSAIVDVATLLHHQQLQQQVAATNLYRAALAEQMRPTDQQAIVRELNELHQRQLSNLTYQIVALVAANLESQNQPPHTSELPVIHKILVKYLIAMVLLQLQQQQQNLEFLRQERLAALVSAQSLERSRGTDSSSRQPQPPLQVEQNSISSAQMQQLLAEAAMLGLSRAHQLLIEAALLIPPLPSGPPTTRPSPPAHHHHHHHSHSQVPTAARGFPSRTGLSPTGAGPQAPRTTTAR